LLSVRGLRAVFETRRGTAVAVDGLDFDIEAGECVGIVGESGSGKSVSFQAVLGLLRAPGQIRAGSIRFEGQELIDMPREQRRRLRGAKMALAMQDALSALNPAFTVGQQIVETIEAHGLATSRAKAREAAVALMARVGIPAAAARIDDYPHQFSGGMRQRIMLAIALAGRPKLLIADEPTTALDVTIRAQVLDLVDRLREELGMAVVLITHDIGIVAERTTRIAVMYAGQIVESGPTAAVAVDPRHPYTRGLLASLPRLDTPEARLRPIPGQPPDPTQLPSGCRFAPRCAEFGEGCEKPQALASIGGRRAVRCHRNQGPNA
jgi:oligopeptide/dipeptide ABC transporter ATP-binding protein